MLNSAALRSRVSTWTRESSSLIFAATGVPSVGVLWSAVASVRSGRRTLRPLSLRPSNACGLVTSCTRCRSMYRMVGGPDSTSWRSQILSNRLFGIPLAPSQAGAHDSEQNGVFSSWVLKVVGQVRVERDAIPCHKRESPSVTDERHRAGLDDRGFAAAR